MQLCTWACAGVSVLSEADVAIITVCVCVCTFWYECPLVVLACESLHVMMYALCVSGAVNTQGFVWKFSCAIYKFSFIHSYYSACGGVCSGHFS